MFFLLVGLAALTMKYMELGPVVALSWWVVLSPFGLAVLWWAWADASGYTARVEMKKMEKRKQERLDKQHSAMGTLAPRRKK